MKAGSRDFGGYYQVSQPDGQIRVRSGNVQFICRDVEEGYRRKRALIHPQDINQHLELAQWCQRQGLLGCTGQRGLRRHGDRSEPPDD